ncbi:hypothetical protein KC946_02530 [Candidatus Saccharibacteria bacterium]|nr:hypothetical protein [Candidatus Saccharibacteria bacterium]
MINKAVSFLKTNYLILYSLIKSRFTKPKSNAKKIKRSGPRRLQKPKYKSFKLSKKLKIHQPKLPTAYRLFRSSLGVVKRNKKLIFGLTFVYALLTLILVNGFGSTLNVTELKDTLSEVFDGNFGNLTVAATLFGALITSAGSSVSATGGVYQTLLLLIFSLATIWSLRRIFAKEQVSVKDSLYKGMYPLVPFLLVLLVIGIQLIPIALGSWVYGVVTTNNIAITLIEKIIWGMLFGLLATFSFYMVSSSIFALFIVTLPDMTPMKALRSARQLVLHRRLLVIRKLLFLPIGLVLVAALIMLPILLWLTIIADWVFFVLTLLGTIFTLIYCYVLYRELLNE